MPRRKQGYQDEPRRVPGDLAERLAEELRTNRECGQPVIDELEFPTGKIRVNVIWDAWDRMPLEDRTDVIFRAYDLAEGREYRYRIALASGLTVPEAHAAGMLPYQIIPAVRKADPVTPDQVRQAMLEEGASTLVNGEALQLRFPTQEDVEACRQRLISRFPGTEDVWLINRELAAQDFAIVDETAGNGRTAI